jgi:hypothetical protein
MEHPLLNIDPNLSVDELQAKITELNRKMGVAHRSGNAHLVTQIQMAIETFRNRYQQKLQELYDSQNRSGTDYSDKIDIS